MHDLDRTGHPGSGVCCGISGALAAPITDAQIRLAQGFLRELDPDVSDLHNLQQRYNDLFLPEDGVHWLH